MIEFFIGLMTGSAVDELDSAARDGNANAAGMAARNARRLNGLIIEKLATLAAGYKLVLTIRRIYFRYQCPAEPFLSATLLVEKVM